MLILPVNLWYSEAMGRRKLVHWLGCFEKKFPFSISLPYPHPPPAEKREGGKRRRWGKKKKGEPGRSAPLASRLGAERLCLAQLLRPLPGGAEARGRSDRFLFLLCYFFFFKSSTRPRSASPKRWKESKTPEAHKGGDMSRPHYLAPPRDQLASRLISCSPPWPLAAPPFPSQRGTQLQPR